jgi:uncharacterized membrane protein YgcG
MPLDAHRRRPSRRLVVAASVAVLGLALLPAIALAQVPTFPPPVNGQRVYDTAEVLRAATREKAEAIADAIEERTGAQVAVLTRLTDPGVTADEAEADAIALMDQWGVGRKGFDDGLVILFDLNRDDPCHGQVQLYAGPGYRATFLSNSERQAIFENDMLPLLRECDLDGALLAAMAKVDANATAEHAARLTQARQLDAVLGLVGGPIVLFSLIAWGAWSWLRYGRDPVYLDDPSIHIPAAPPGLTPAAGALVREGRSTRRALTAALLDLASRGEIAFSEDKTGLFGLGGKKVGVLTSVPDPTDPVDLAHRDRARRRRLDEATKNIGFRLSTLAEDGFVKPEDMPKLGQYVSNFNEKLEEHAVAQGWFTEPPGKATTRWRGRGILAIIGGGIAIFGGLNLPSNGLLILGIAAVAGGILLLAMASAMPARTMPGAMIRAMLEAYRRTLDKTMQQARSMGQVVDEAAIPLLETPDDAVVWGVALGLQDRVEQVLERTVDDLKEGRTQTGYLPVWYGSGGHDGGWQSSGGGSGGWAPGLMSSSAVPNFGGMMAALSTIGNSPSSSGSGGGFGGGGSGGGGGGAGGGF